MWAAEIEICFQKIWRCHIWISNTILCHVFNFKSWFALKEVYCYATGNVLLWPQFLNLFRFATVKHHQLGSDKSPGQQPLGGGQPERAGADPGLQLVLNITWLQRRPPAEFQACGRRRKWAAGRRPRAGSSRYFNHANGGLKNAREFGKLTFLVGIRPASTTWTKWVEIPTEQEFIYFFAWNMKIQIDIIIALMTFA